MPFTHTNIVVRSFVNEELDKFLRWEIFSTFLYKKIPATSKVFKKISMCLFLLCFLIYDFSFTPHPEVCVRQQLKCDRKQLRFGFSYLSWILKSTSRQWWRLELSFKKGFVLVFLSSFFHLKYEEVILNNLITEFYKIELFPKQEEKKNSGSSAQSWKIEKRERGELREWETCPNLACPSQNYKEKNEVYVIGGRESSE